MPKSEDDRIDTLYICDWLPPDFGAVGQYSLLFAREMASKGEKVVLVGLSSAASSEEKLSTPSGGELTVIRIKAPPLDKTSTRKRMAWTARTNTMILRKSWPLLRRTKRALFTGSPPLFLHWIAPTRWLHGARLEYRITDFHPECAIAERGSPGLFLRLILGLTLFWRRRVDVFEALGQDQKKRLEDMGVSQDRIRIKPDPSPVQVAPDQPPLGRPDGADGKKLLLYSGNWGVAHDVDTFVAGYTRHHSEGGQVILWLNAVGTSAQKVEANLKESNTPFIRSNPVPIEDLASLLVTADAHLITLKDAFVGYVLPSKVHGCIASGKPILYVGSEASDVHLLCSQASNDYHRVRVGDVKATAQALADLGR